MTSLPKICSVVLLAVAFTLPAYAGEGGDRAGGRKGKGRHGHAAKFFKKHDANQDGALTEDEVPAKAWTRLAKCDADGDGAVTKAELAKCRHAGKKGGRRKGGKKDGGSSAD